jgi:hypothetical protein
MKKIKPEEGLKQWIGNMDYIIDEVLEYLHDTNCLNKKGEKLAHDYWLKYIKGK